ncbi:MAG: N-acetylneuraminate synthase family protein [Candidatus Auribacterota bacterium]|jgi:N-acetylneuraminate synthase/sialic acid synthase|uniref:N-acetylneuraminate synthase n=1 Tax=Candidatus Auribacter fodinae TaxID=2093366 RepID=A0A3A4R107_9BACT|nr:MAG: N-acetylneuraminate synthase [Candidatus Auribacter fodinae]
MKSIKFGKSVISSDGPCYFIAEIGHNHQGDFSKALEMIKVAAECGADAVKFQKRDNKSLYTKAMYNKPYDNENSFGDTYGEHREFLEFGWDEYVELKQCAEENNVEFMSTVFDFASLEFLERLGIGSYKIASADVTNIPLITEVARTGKPVILSTGAAMLDEVRKAYDTILRFHDKLCLLHCTCSYPAEYETLSLKVIQTLKNEFPEAVIGYSGHDNGILAPVIAYMLGATVVEKHFTLNHASKGTDHKFSLEPIGLKKQIRDLKRIDVALGDGTKKIWDYEISARKKMGKSLYFAQSLPAGHILTKDDIVLKSPGDGLLPYELNNVVGCQLMVDVKEEQLISYDQLATSTRKSLEDEEELILSGA